DITSPTPQGVSRVVYLPFTGASGAFLHIHRKSSPQWSMGIIYLSYKDCDFEQHWCLSQDVPRRNSGVHQRRCSDRSRKHGNISAISTRHRQI
ncbi:hypothetical protein V3C99_011446, partial [Haemonchus contortus]|uniref:Uncharacterized protein n=1 Tax=Haemonchus contortus TaxID=6289 RepID=A0A7I5E7V8_HAECO